MQDLMQEMTTLRVLLDRALTECKERGKTLAKCEHDYQVADAKFIAEQRTNGVPVTIVLSLAKGDPNIAKLRMERDIASTLYDTSKEAINTYKLQMRILSEQIDREWKN